MSIWESNARYLESVYGVYVNWEERFYICPECSEPVYERDWSIDDLCDYYCPICLFLEYDEEEEDF